MGGIALRKGVILIVYSHNTTKPDSEKYNTKGQHKTQDYFFAEGEALKIQNTEL